MVGGKSWGEIPWRSPDWKPKSRNDNTLRAHNHQRNDNKNDIHQKRVAIDPPQSELTDKLIGLCISCDPSSIVSISPMKTNKYR